MASNPISTLDSVQPADLDSGPIVVLNLLKFKTSEALVEYLHYATRVLAAFGDKGIEVIYAGALKERIEGDIGEWDAVLLGRYPSRRVFYEMLRSDEYQALSPQREHALERAVLWPSEPVLPYRTRTVEFEGGDWLGVIEGLQR